MAATLQIATGGRTIGGELYTPALGGPAGLIALAYGSDGLFDSPNGPWKTMILDYASALMTEGFAVVVPNYLAATMTSPGQEAIEQIGLHRTDWIAAIGAAIDQAAGLPTIDGRRIGLLGFSLGGHLCLHLRSKAKVLVEYFAPMLDGIGAPGAPAYAQIHHGKSDQTVGYENAGRIATVLGGEQAAVDLNAYDGAGHGFVGADAGNATARTLSKQRTLAFFKQHL
jgi:dienelactone hydrolase